MLTKNAPAKINLGLNVLRKRDDGFHDIETVFLRIPWLDVLHVEPSDELTLTCSDSDLPTDDRNLVMKAARLLMRHVEQGHGARFHLEKRIPYGAGLGGGSSDAAAALQLLNELWALGLDPTKLAECALEIGSDVPFFIGSGSALGPASYTSISSDSVLGLASNTSSDSGSFAKLATAPQSAFATGRGEQLEPMIDPRTDEPFRPEFPLVVAVPEEDVSTATAYSMITPYDGNRSDLREVILSHDLERWRRELTNDFEKPVLRMYPAIAELKAALEAAGAGYASLTGTGSAVFGFFAENDQAAAAAEALRQSGHRTWTGVV